MKRMLIAFWFATVIFMIGPESGLAQEGPVWRTRIPDRLGSQTVPSHQAIAQTDSVSFYKRKADWKKIIAQYWGPGEPTAQKQTIFDTYVAYVRAKFPCFAYLKTNWDSVATYWRSKITDSTSRGEFSAILENLAYVLNDWHAYAADSRVVDGALNPGTPVVTVPWINRDVRHFGAALSLLPDTSLLVYKVVPNHPLGLQPGDRVLGYEGVRWAQLVDELIEGGAATDVLLGGCPSAKFYHRMVWAGMAWHLFDTIDVVKYGTGKTVHMPTSPLTGLDVSAPLLQCDQLPISGVPMPSEELLAGNVTFGKVQGTNIGYIYVRHHADPKISGQFDAAVCALSNTDGLIIDLRMARGGSYGLQQGIARLIDFGDTTTTAKARCSGSDLYSLCTIDVAAAVIPADAGTSYPNPVAVLVGPQSSSYGDESAREFTYVPNARFFGKSPMGAYSGFWTETMGPTVPGFYLQCPDFLTVDYHHPNRQIWEEEFPVDEEVWLTPDDVANGDDTVVKRALEWITTPPHAHDVAIDRTYVRPGLDSVCITATLVNLLHHAAALSAVVTDTGGAVRDSVRLYNDGLHGDGSAADSIWGCRVPAPLDEGLFGVSVRTDDVTQGTFRRLPNAARFATAGPMTVDSLVVTLAGDGSYIVKPYIKNNGASFTASGVSVTVICTDSSAEYITPKTFALPSVIPPGGISSPSGVCYVYPSVSFHGHFNLKFEVALNGYVYWSNSTRLVVTGVKEKEALPVAYALHQNYPNPFNPGTTINFELPKASLVNLTVFDILGREVSVLVNDRRNAGVHEVKFDCSNLASGVYFYRLQAADFVSTRKMQVVK